ncbi:MAG: glycosyltransferase [Saprospiraceae bacterium]|nr:glycosyltransferase [Candidatus Vicinibacter affinis]
MSSVVIIGPAHPLRGGLASFDERLTRAFIQAGWEAEIYTFSLQYPGFLFPGTTQYSDEPAPNDLKINVCINSVNPLNWFKIGKILSKKKPNLVIVRYWLPFMGPCLGTILKILKTNNFSKIICIADNVIPHEKRPGDVWFSRFFLEKPHAFITMSEKVNTDLLRFRPEAKSKIVDHPLYDNFGDKIDVSIARDFLKISKSAKIVLFFGFIRKYKGLDLLIRAFAEPMLSNSDIKLVVAGEFYEDAQPYLKLITELNLENKIILHTHFIPDSEVKYYLSACDVVVQPYKNATQSGVTPLAYHFEKPMIVTNVGALPRLVPHEKVGLVCEPNPNDIALAIKRFFEFSEGYFLEGLLEEKKKLSWPALVSSILSLQNDLEK